MRNQNEGMKKHNFPSKKKLNTILKKNNLPLRPKLIKIVIKSHCVKVSKKSTRRT